MEIDTIVRAGVFLGWLVAASALLLRRRGRREAQTHQPSRGAIVGIALQLAGMAIARDSATSDAAVIWTIMYPELSPGSAVRKAGRP